jgi:hypothetical protein
VRAIGMACIASAVALAAMGAVTACALLYAMAHGRFDFPARLWLPLPRVSDLFVEPTDRSGGRREGRPPGSESPAA